MQLKMRSKKLGKWGVKKLGLWPSKLEKAQIFLLLGKSGLMRTDPLEVQFNPSEYRISRGIIMTDKHPLGKDGTDSLAQAVAGQPATMSCSLYFDTVTELNRQTLTGGVQSLLSGTMGMAAIGGAAKSIAKDLFRSNSFSGKPVAVADEIGQLLRFAHDAHAPLKVEFVWGNLDFIGYVLSSTIDYTMFDPDGTPIRAKVDLTIKGEEKAYIQSSVSLPNQSPDRTKERRLISGEQLWQMADQEYDDPGKWKVIAQANGILNPRTLGNGVTLKVPSIK